MNILGYTQVSLIADFIEHKKSFQATSTWNDYFIVASILLSPLHYKQRFRIQALDH